MPDVTDDALPIQRVGIVVFADVAAVDYIDGAAIVVRVVRRALVDAPNRTPRVDGRRDLTLRFTNDREPSDVRDVTIHKMTEVGIAARNGDVWVRPTTQPFPRDHEEDLS